MPKSGNESIPTENASLIRPLAIGPVTTPTNLVLAPMSGVTDCAFRSVVRAASGEDVGLLVSEFVASEGLTRDNPKTCRMLRYKESERPISIQIFGADVERMTRAARMVEEVGADIVDVNCGCPAPKVVRRGGGAELMRQADTLRSILRGIRRAVSIPVTVKVRAGWDDHSRNALAIARLAEDEGAAMVAVHGRTRLQLYRGEADWDLVAEVKDALSVPVLGSGDVVDPSSALARLEGGYADGLMIGRAAIGNPWVFRQIAAAATGRPVPKPSLEERLAALRLMREGLAETLPERAYLGRYRGLACRMIKGMPDGAAARRDIGAAADGDAIDALLTAFLTGDRAGNGFGDPAGDRAGAASLADVA